tara:strand:+ start:365 stop:1162 length:798 start_codon:yes stop_codon:yes gene_type:complete
MKVLSIDVGIKNLALCLFNIENKEEYKIVKWNVINLCNEIIINCHCGKPAKYNNKDNFCCKKHIKDTGLLLIPPDLEIKKLKKKKIVEIKEILTSQNIDFNPKQSKILLLEEKNKEFEDKYVLPFSNKINTNDLNLIELGINLNERMNELYNDDDIDIVIIENQISPIANRMKTLQGMIAQYFIMKKTHDIQFISASNKLKDYVSKKTTYTERKHKGIEICEELLINNEQFSEHLTMFNSHKKKDDLADCFLQGIWFLKDKIIYY